MNLFRSEEHVQRWLRGRPGGATIPVGQLCDLAHAWWGDRLDPDWRPHSREQNQAILDAVGLTDPFWRLP
jgi:hypothetical protein